MGNLSFLIPTKNKSDFKFDNIKRMISEHFTQFVLRDDEIYEEINVWTKDEETLITTLYFNHDCYVLEFDKDLYFLKEKADNSINEKIKAYYQNLYDKLLQLKELNPNIQKCLASTHGSGRMYKDKCRIEKMLKDEFGCYIFDEGIHPEFMPPDYQYKHI